MLRVDAAHFSIISSSIPAVCSMHTIWIRMHAMENVTNFLIKSLYADDLLSVHRLRQAFFKREKNRRKNFKYFERLRMSSSWGSFSLSLSRRVCISGSELLVLLKIDLILYLAIKWMWFWCFIMWFKCMRSSHARTHRFHSQTIALKRAQREICISRLFA